MMRPGTNSYLCLLGILVLLGCAGCHRHIGEPNDSQELMRPDQVVSFDHLYKQNCSACHGNNGTAGPALDLANPRYQTLVDDASLKRWITSGMPGTQMPAFGESAGGLLTEKQIDALVAGMRKRWSPEKADKVNMPAYAEAGSGDVERGAQVYRAACLSCHQQQKITDPTYLSLISDQALRTIVIAGRPDLGHPDSRHMRPDGPLSDQDVTDVVAYLNSFRTDTPGQPYPERNAER